MKVYLDTCVWCRLFDEPDEEISKEIEAIYHIFELRDKGEVEIVGSSAVLAEIELISDEDKRRAVEALIKTVSNYIVRISEKTVKLAETIKKECKLKDMDAIHVALASEHVEVFITVDKGILKKSKCLEKYITVMNVTDFR